MEFSEKGTLKILKAKPVNKIFIDANILIDNFDGSRAFHAQSYNALKYAIEKDIKIYTSSDIITTIYYVLKKRFSNVIEYIKKLSTICDIVGFTNSDLNKALYIMETNTEITDFEDTIQYIIAQKINCSLIISNDKNFPHIDIKVVSSKEFTENFR
ncbi:MAG: PIN domain-containing protein [Deltaproteobacteria bacterium]|nr:PIN domain-containing protein [Deltaproteobacteria bacterium]